MTSQSPTRATGPCSSRRSPSACAGPMSRSSKASMAGHRRVRRGWCSATSRSAASSTRARPARSAKATWSSASSGGPTRCRARTARLVNGTCAATASTERGIKEIDGFMSERWRIEPEYAMKVDPSLGLLGVLLEPTTVVTKAWEQVQTISRRALWEGRKVLVTGAGPIGLLAALVGQQHGFEVHVLDRVESGAKPDLVRALGATYHAGGVADIGFQPDVIVECTGVGQVIADSVNVVAAGGIVCLTGVGTGGRTVGQSTADIAATMVLQNNVIVGSVVREDYSENGDAWNFFTHDHARSRAYRWGEDGIAGISDDKQRLCFAWPSGTARIPSSRSGSSGLTNSEGNHGEDVKEYYFYLDSTPTHSYMKYLYKYPQAAYPYADLVETNRRRTRDEMEYELLDTGVFNDDRYFDVFVEYAKGAAEDILVQITAVNRGPDAADLHLLPTLWFRNDWSTWIAESNRAAEKPHLKQIEAPAGTDRGRRGASAAGRRTPLSCEGDVPLLFTENETNHERLFPGHEEREPARQGRHQRLRGPRPAGRGESREAGHQGRGALPGHGRRRQTAT